MVMLPQLTPVLAGALTILVGSLIVFGHRFVDQSGKFSEKINIDELNEIRIAIRSETPFQ